jgi:hypothetical protein
MRFFFFGRLKARVKAWGLNGRRHGLTAPSSSLELIYRLLTTYSMLCSSNSFY